MSDIGIDDPRPLARDREVLDQLHASENVPQGSAVEKTSVPLPDSPEASVAGLERAKCVPSRVGLSSLELSPQGLAALDLARAGLPVFPCGINKRPLTQHGFKDATLNLDQVAAWWHESPNAMIGIPTGEPSGVSVVDLDVDKSSGAQIGEDSLLRIAPELLDGPGCTTPSGGRHLYFRHLRGLRNTVGRIGPGVDTRGESGYVIAPPSRGKNGDYVLSGPVDWKNLPEMPDKLARLLLVHDHLPSSFQSPSLDEVRDILDHIDPDSSYQDWLAVLMGLHSRFGGSGQGLDVADSWSRRGRKYVPGEVTRKWAGFAPLGGTAWPTVCDLARQNGADLAAIARRHRGTREPSLTQPRSADQSPGALFFSAACLDGLPVPERKWLVPDLIPSGTVTLLSGDGGTGKSLLALQLAVAVATSTGWLGRGVLGGKAVFLSAEDDRAELHRRLSDIARAGGMALRTLTNLDLCSLAGEDALLAMLHMPGAALTSTPLYNQIDATMSARKPELLVLDTLADLFPGNENDRTQARQFIGLLRKLAMKHDSALLLLAHPSLSGMTSGVGTSGSTGWNNSVRSRLYFERVVQDRSEANPDARVLRTMKSNYGPIGGEIAMTWRDGVFVADQTETGLDRMANGAKAERVFLKLLRMFSEQGQRVNAKNGPSSAPCTFARHPEAEGIRKTAFNTAMQALLSRGIVKIAEEGPQSRRVSYLFEVL